MNEVFAFLGTSSGSLPTFVGFLTVLITCGTILVKVTRSNTRMESKLEYLKTTQDEIKAEQKAMTAEQKAMNAKLDGLEKDNTEIKAEQKVTNSKFDGLEERTAELKGTVDVQANDLNELRNKQTSDSKEIFDRIVAAEANLAQQSSDIQLGLAQVYKLSTDDLNAFRTENYRSFSFMRDMLGYIRQDIGLIQGILGIFHSRSADANRFAGA